eukprot:gb/GEZN01000216.1/.p1 GENE.gb/GEZN01000216.1/~~gb/GEZN01000216.1/.p1  ORF type:complete len:1742 (+),score=327.19 gb/GEZN01000216.1/:124-5349(+)
MSSSSALSQKDAAFFQTSVAPPSLEEEDHDAEAHLLGASSLSDSSDTSADNKVLDKGVDSPDSKVPPPDFKDSPARPSSINPTALIREGDSKLDRILQILDLAEVKSDKSAAAGTPAKACSAIQFIRQVQFSGDDRLMALLDQDSRLSVFKVGDVSSRMEVLGKYNVVESCFADDDKNRLLVLATDRTDPDFPCFFPPPNFWQNQPPESQPVSTSPAEEKKDEAKTEAKTEADKESTEEKEKKEEVKSVSKTFSLYRLDLSSWDPDKILASKVLLWKQTITGKGRLRVGASFSPNTSLLAVWDLHNMDVRIWFATEQEEDSKKTGDKQLFKHLKDPHGGNAVYDCSWGGNSLFATSAADGVRIFDVAQTANASLDAALYMQTKAERTTRVEFSPNGRNLITESLTRWKPTSRTWDTQVSLWNVVDNFTRIYSFPMEAEPFFSLDGNLLASVLPSTVKIALWAIEGAGVDAKVVRLPDLEGHTDLPWRLRWGEDGRLASVGRDGYLRVWQIVSKEKKPRCKSVIILEKTISLSNVDNLKCFRLRGPQQLAWSHSGSHLLVGCLPELPGKDRVNNAFAWMWSLRPDHLVRSFDSGKQPVCFAYQPTAYLASQSKRRSISGVHTSVGKDGEREQWLALGGLQSVSLVSLMPEDIHSASVSVPPPQSLKSLPFPQGSKGSDLVKALAFSPDGRYLVAVWGSLLVSYDLQREVWADTVSLAKNKVIESIAFSSGAEFLAVADQLQVTIYKFALETGKLEATLALKQFQGLFKTNWRNVSLKWPTAHPEETSGPKRWFDRVGLPTVDETPPETKTNKKKKTQTNLRQARYLVVVASVDRRDSAWLFDLEREPDLAASARNLECDDKNAEENEMSLPEMYQKPLFSGEDVKQVAWANGGEMVFATAERPAVVRLWHPFHAEETVVAPSPRRSIHGFAETKYGPRKHEISQVTVDLQSVYKGHTGAQVQTVHFSSDNMKLVSSSGSSLRVWSKQGHNLGFLRGHVRPILDARFGAADTRVISIDERETRVWSNYTHVCLAILPYYWPVLGADFSLNGRFIYTWLVSGEVLSWQTEGLSLTSNVTHCFNPVGFGSQQARSSFCKSLQCHQPVKLPEGSRFPALSTLLHLAVLRDDVLAVEAFTSADSAAFSPGALGEFFPENADGHTAIDLALQFQQRHLLSPMLFHLTDTRVPPEQRWALTKAIGNGLAKSYPDLLLATMRRLPMVSASGLGVHNPANRYSNLETQYKGSWDLAEPSLWDESYNDGENDEDRLAPLWSRILGCCLPDTNRRRRKQAAAKGGKIQSKERDLDPSYEDMTGLSVNNSAATTLNSMTSSREVGQLEDKEESKEEEEDLLDGSEKEGGRPAEAFFVPLPALTASYYRQKAITKDMRWSDKWRANKYPGQSPLKAVVAHGLTDVIATDAFKAAIEFKWRRFARPILSRQIFRFCVFLILYSVAVSQMTYDICPDYSMSKVDAGVVWDALLAILTLINLRFVFLEVRQLWRDGWEYFNSIWNWFDMAAYSGVCVVCVLRLTCSPYTASLSAVVVILMWFKLLEYGRAFMATGKFVLMLLRMVEGIGSFMFVMLVVYIGFSMGFAILLGQEDSATGDDNKFTGYRVLVASWEVLGGGNPLLESFGWKELSLLSWVLFFIYSFTAWIVLMNLLVAVMSSIYTEIESNVEGPWLIERAKIVLQVEREHGWEIRKKKWERKNFPRWIHKLTPVEDAHETNEPTAIDGTSFSDPNNLKES